MLNLKYRWESTYLAIFHSIWSWISLLPFTCRKPEANHQFLLCSISLQGSSTHPDNSPTDQTWLAWLPQALTSSPKSKGSSISQYFLTGAQDTNMLANFLPMCPWTSRALFWKKVAQDKSTRSKTSESTSSMQTMTLSGYVYSTVIHSN